MGKTLGGANPPAASLLRQKQKRYQLSDDSTLSRKQRLRRSFRSARAIRVRSAKTRKGYSTGLHEAVTTTDTLAAFDRAKALRNRQVLIRAKSARSPLYRPAGLIADKAHADVIAAVGDSLRTDTARTILSARSDRVAGHSGSNVDTTNQPEAHDLLREATVDLLGLSKSSALYGNRKALTVAMGAVMVASMAPGELASKATGSGSLKDAGAKLTWEGDREEAKLRLDALESTLTRGEKREAQAFAGRFIKKLSSTGARVIEVGRSRSPLRDRKGSGGIAGGRYLASSSASAPKQAPPSDPVEWGFYLSAPFRQARA